jgi:hypothetical protein
MRCEHDVPFLVDLHVSRNPRAVYPQQQAVSDIIEIAPDDMARAAAACVQWCEGGGSERAGTRRPCEARAADASGAGSARGWRRTRQDAGCGRDSEAQGQEMDAAHASRSASTSTREKEREDEDEARRRSFFFTVGTGWARASRHPSPLRSTVLSAWFSVTQVKASRCALRRHS